MSTEESLEVFYLLVRAEKARRAAELDAQRARTRYYGGLFLVAFLAGVAVVIIAAVAL
jgi:hypothetical protein